MSETDKPEESVEPNDEEHASPDEEAITSDTADAEVVDAEHPDEDAILEEDAERPLASNTARVELEAEAVVRDDRVGVLLAEAAHEP